MTVKLDGQTEVTLQGSTKKVDVQLHQGKQMKNYYWLSGPGPNDSGRRVTVLHSNQGPRQCGHCLRTAAPPGTTDLESTSYYQGGGNAKTCKTINTERTRLSSYLSQLRAEGYSSLRDIHFESQRTNFPLLGSFQPPQPVNMLQVDLPDREADDDHEDDDTQTGDPPETEKVQVSDGEVEPNNDSTASDPKSPTIDNDIMTSPSQFGKD